MTDILALLDHPTTSSALILARRWCKGRSVGERDALTHSLHVVDTLHQHTDAAPDVVAAALLHDSPDLAPPTIDLDAALARISPEVVRLVRALQHEHDELDKGATPAPPAHDLGLMPLSAADKLISIDEMVHQGRTSADTAAYWARHHGIVAALPYLRTFHQAAHDVLPPKMVADLHDVLGLAEHDIDRPRGRR